MECSLVPGRILVEHETTAVKLKAKLLKFPFLLLAFLALSTTVPSYAADLQATANSLVNNVVRIEAEPAHRARTGRSAGEGSGEERATSEGFGIIVGERNGSIYIVTDDHVVKPARCEDRHTCVSGTVRVLLHDDLSKGGLVADLLADYNNAFDLAVLRIPAQPGLSWQAAALGDKEELRRGTKIVFIGREEKWSIPTTESTIGNLMPERFEVESQSIVPGTSGAPLIGQTGILGLVTADGGTGNGVSYGVPIEAVHIFIEGLDLPWNLTSREHKDPRLGCVYYDADPKKNETVVDFSAVVTPDNQGYVPAAPVLHEFGIEILYPTPQKSEILVMNNRVIYGGGALKPRSQNILTQTNTDNVPASFTLKFRQPLDMVSFVIPAVYGETESGVTCPAWSAHALDSSGGELSSHSEGLLRSFGDVPARLYTLRAPAFEPIAAVRFDSDPRLDGKPFAGFSAIVIERLILSYQANPTIPQH
jgi:S1-C subfamily serine protease